MSHVAARYHDISCGHRVFGHENKCRNLHGHNYRIHFYCAAELDKIGRVIDFTVIKDLLCNWLEANWDHKFLIWTKDPWYMLLYAFDQTVRSVPFNPTAENMAQYLVDVIGPQQLKGTGVVLDGVTVEETRKCEATYVREGKNDGSVQRH